MNERQLDKGLDPRFDERLSAWFRPIATEAAPPALRAAVQAIPDRFPARRPWLAVVRSRPAMVLVTVGLLLALAIGVAILVGSQHRLPAPLGIGLIAFDSGGDIDVAGRDGTGRRALTSGPAVDFSPTWSLDGSMIAFWRQATVDPPGSGISKEASTALVVMNADGSNPRVLVDHLVYPDWTGPQWSPNGRQIAYAADTIPTSKGRTLGVVGLDGSAPVVLQDAGDVFTSPRWAPDGRTLAYAALGGLHVASPDGAADRLLVATDVAGSVWWSPDGSRIAYLSSACCGPIHDTWVVGVNGGATGPITHSNGTETFGGWSADGRYTVISETQPDGAVRLVVADAEGRNGTALDATGVLRIESWSVDGDRLLVRTAAGLLILDPVGGEPPVAIAANEPTSVSWQPVGPRVAVLPLPPTPSRSADPEASAVPDSLTRRSTTGFSIPFSFDAAALPGGPSYPYHQGAASAHAYDITSEGGDIGLAAFDDPRLFADPCHPSRGFAKTGSTPADLAAALRSIPGLKAGSPSPATLGGFSGIAIDLRSTSLGRGCEHPTHLSVLEADPGVVETYDFANQGTSESGCCAPETRFAPGGGAIASRWLILDVRGSRVVIEAWAIRFPGELGTVRFFEPLVQTIKFE